MAFHRKLILKKYTDKVKTVDLHPSEPWVLSSHYNGTAVITNYSTEAIIRTFTISDSPVRVGKFIAQKNWIVIGSDDNLLRIFNYNTGKKVCQLEGHTDYIRDIAVHPTRPIFLSSSDDQTIRQWSWNTEGDIVREQRCHEGHDHFVMSISINPKDPNSFATCSLDRTIKTWSLSMSSPLQTIPQAHEKGCNWVCYYHGLDKPYLLSAGDDSLIKVWDSQNKSLIKVLSSHTDNVSSLSFHPMLPLLFSVSEDGCMMIWKMPSFQLQEIIPLELGSLWNICLSPNFATICGDNGFSVFEICKGTPPISLLGNKLFFTQNSSEVVSCNLSSLSSSSSTTNDKVQTFLNLNSILKDHGPLEYSSISALIHSPNGRYIAALGDDQFNIHSTLGFRSKCFGSCEQLVWSSFTDSHSTASEGSQFDDTFAVLQANNSIVIYENFEESKRLTVTGGGGGANGSITIFGGPLLGIVRENSITFHDWNTLELIRRMEVSSITSISWAPSPLKDGKWKLIISSEKSIIYLLKYNPLHSKSIASPDGGGYEESFIFITELPSIKPSSSIWLDCDVFIFINTCTNCLQYLLGDGHLSPSFTIQKKNVFIVGIISIVDNSPKALMASIESQSSLKGASSFFSQTLPISLIMFEKCIIDGDIRAGKEKYLPLIEEEDVSKLSLFLKNLYYKTKDISLLEFALSLATDLPTKFSLSSEIGDIDLSFKILMDDDDVNGVSVSSLNNKNLWSLLGDSALIKKKWSIYEESLKRTESWGRLLLFYVVKNAPPSSIRKVGEMAHVSGDLNVAFSSFYRIGDLMKCYNILLHDEKRPWEAVIFARSHSLYYGDAFKKWKEYLSSIGKDDILLEVDGCYDVGVAGDVASDVDDYHQQKGNDEEKDTIAPLPVKTMELIDDENFSIDVNYDSINGGSLCSDDYSPNVISFPGDPVPDPVMDFDDCNGFDNDSVVSTYSKGNRFDAVTSAVNETDSYSLSAVNETDSYSLSAVNETDSYSQSTVNEFDSYNQSTANDTDDYCQSSVNEFDSYSQSFVNDTDDCSQFTVNGTDIKSQSSVNDSDSYSQSNLTSFKIPPLILLKDEDDPLDLGDLKEGLDDGWN